MKNIIFYNTIMNYSAIILFILLNTILYLLPIISSFIKTESILTYHVWINVISLFYLLLPK